MCCCTVTLTQTRDTSLGLSAVAVSFYDGQGILVNRKLGVKSAKNSTAPRSACEARPPS